VAAGQRLLPIRLELDFSDEDMTPECARFIKNLSFFRGDTSEVSTNQSGKTGKYRPLEATQVYDESFQLPPGVNHYIGACSVKEENCVILHWWNSLGNHSIWYVNGEEASIQKVYVGECLNFQLRPENFIHEAGAWLEVFNYIDPETDLPRKRSYYFFTDGYNDMRFICIEDAIATDGFNQVAVPYLQSSYSPCLLINAGVPDPEGCPEIVEVQNDDRSQQNNLRFNTWQFRTRFIDVYGRPSEWGDISELYIPGKNDCLGTSDFLPRCLDIVFDAGYPLVNIIEVAFRNCNSPQWYKDNSLFLYKGSNLSDWWKRGRNPEVNYNAETNKITYRFCKDKECDPIDQNETNRTQNPIPRVTQSIAKIGKYLSVWNNRSGFAPLGTEILEQISLTVTPPDTAVSSPVRSAEIFVPIYNVYIGTYQPVYEIEGGQWVWGGRKDFTDDYVNTIASGYQMYFGDLNRSGFIGYLAGTGIPPASTVSELYYVNNDNEMVKVEDFSIIHEPSEYINDVDFLPVFKRKYYLKFTFNNVAPATYVFRIADHRAKLGDTNFYNTSTYVAGQFLWADKDVQFNYDNPYSLSKEIIVDLCNQNYDSLNDNKVLAIYDMTEPRNEGASRSKIVDGYIYETKVNDKYQTPIELLNTRIAGDDRRNGFISDHNGFYFGSVRRDNGFDVIIEGYCNCVKKEIRNFRVEGSEDRLYTNTFDLKTELDSECKSFPDNPCNRVIIKGKVTECDSGLGVPGVGIVLTRGRYTLTNENGEYSIIAHYDSRSNTGRSDTLYYTPTTCSFTGCDSICVEPIPVLIFPCNPSATCSEIIMEVAERQIDYITERGLLSGGNYGVAIWGEDWLGRHQFAQTKDSFYFTTPTLIQTKTLAPSSVEIFIPPSVTFPSWMTELNFGITKELSMNGVYITWIVDKVEFVDNSGNVNDIAPTQIKIWYSSLNEYNAQNNFNTTTGWQFIVQDPNGNQQNVTSDYVEFYINGDGSFFPELVRALVKYDNTGQYFLINYDSALKNLKQYAQIRLGRPQDCANKGSFYQVCGTVKVVNGKAQKSRVVLNAFDTYYKYRQIPIPVGSEEDPQNIVRNFGFPFEHHSPSDFWGDHCINIGAPNVRNPYEAELTKENEVMLSGAISVNGQLNFFNYFDEALSKNFNTWDFGGVVAALPQTGVVLVICQNDTFTVGYADNLLRQTPSGIQVPSGENAFGEPNRKLGLNYGCSFFDKNTIREKQSLVQWLDSRECALIQHNYSDVYIVSRVDLSKGIVGGIDSWLRSKVKYVQEWNKNNPENKKYFHGGIDPNARQYLLSDYTIGQSEYVNNEREVKVEKNETIAFDYLNNFFREFISYTPQGYAFLEGQAKDIQLFSVANNTLFLHYTQSLAKQFNIFYGQSVNRVIRTVTVLDKMQKKKFLTITVMGKNLYFADQIITDSNQLTRMLKSAFKQGDFYWQGAVRCNLATPNDPNYPGKFEKNVLEGDLMYGSILDVRLIGDPDEDTVFTELVGIIVDANQEGKATP
jgi:hypothetical protein